MNQLPDMNLLKCTFSLCSQSLCHQHHHHVEGGRTHIFFSSTLAKFSASRIVSPAWASTGAFHWYWWRGGTTGALNQFQNTVWFAGEYRQQPATCHPVSSSPEWKSWEWQVSPWDPGPRYWPVGGHAECAASRPLGLVAVCQRPNADDSWRIFRLCHWVVGRPQRYRLFDFLWN